MLISFLDAPNIWHLRKKCQMAAASAKRAAAEENPNTGRRPSRELGGSDRM